MPELDRIEKYRQSTFYSRTGALRGRVLEIGFGRGGSLKAYASADLVCAVELSERRVSGAAGIKRGRGITHLELIRGSAMHLPFGDNIFDAAVTMFAVCSFKDPGLALSEIRRVLKPDGMYLALEHTISEKWAIRAVQNLLSKPTLYFSGCNLKSDPVRQITSSGFKIKYSEYIPFFYEPTLMIEAKKMNQGSDHPDY